MTCVFLPLAGSEGAVIEGDRDFCVLLDIMVSDRAASRLPAGALDRKLGTGPSHRRSKLGET